MQATAATHGYLDDVGLLDGEPPLLVEMGGRGTTGRLLTRVLEHLGGGPATRELYFGLHAEVLEPGRRDLQANMYDDWRGRGWPSARQTCGWPWRPSRRLGTGT